MAGELHVIMGPMFSSKSSELIRQVEKYTALDIPVFVVNHSLDTRYCATSIGGRSVPGIYTHDGKRCEGVQTADLSELFDIPAYALSLIHI